MMSREDRQEALSLAYIKAVAAYAGMTYSVPSKDYGIDITLNEVERRDNRLFETGLRIDIQAKSTTTAIETRTTIDYDRLVRGYDDLRFESRVPRILVVLVLPPDERDWFRQTKSKLELRKGLHWLSLRGSPAVRNRSTIRVNIPKRQVFTPDSLRWIMNRVRSREKLS